MASEAMDEFPMTIVREVRVRVLAWEPRGRMPDDPADMDLEVLLDTGGGTGEVAIELTEHETVAVAARVRERAIGRVGS